MSLHGRTLTCQDLIHSWSGIDLISKKEPSLWSKIQGTSGQRSRCKLSMKFNNFWMLVLSNASSTRPGLLNIVPMKKKNDRSDVHRLSRPHQSMSKRLVLTVKLRHVDQCYCQSLNVFIGYNQIKMDPFDDKKTIFQTLWAIFNIQSCRSVLRMHMPLTNAR